VKLRLLSGAEPHGEGSGIIMFKELETGIEKYREFSVLSGLSMGRSHRRSFITRLRPQMKKYLCLWYLSTKNHNI
jgi:hypothetical protein